MTDRPKFNPDPEPRPLVTGPDFERINQAALSAYPALLSTLLPGGRVQGRELVCGDLSGKAGRSLSVNLDRGVWKDFSTGEGGSDPVSLWAAVHGCSQGEAARMLAAQLGLSGTPRQTASSARVTLVAADTAPKQIVHPTLGEPHVSWLYRNPAGQVIGVVCRWNQPGGKTIRPLTPHRDAGGGIRWQWKGWADHRPLYNLDRLVARPGAAVLVVEGEKAADAAQELFPDMVATTWPHGAESASKADFSPLLGRVVFAWPDADEPGHKAARVVCAAAVAAGAGDVLVVTPPEGVADGWDLADALAEGWTHEMAADWLQNHSTRPVGEPPEIDRISEAKKRVIAAIGLVQGESPDPGAVFEPDVLDALRLLRQEGHAEFQRLRLQIKKASRDIRIGDLDAAIRDGEECDAEKETAATLVDMVRERCTLFHCPDNDSYAEIERDGHSECWGITSEGFEEWLSYEFYTSRGRVPGDKPLRAALATLAGIARFEGPERPVHLRVASHDGVIWLDLCDPLWRAIRITAGGWSIEARPPVMFVRTGAMRPLPEPVPGGDLAALWRIVNIPEDDRLFVLTWVLECLRSETPYAVLELTGEEGSAKSSTQHYLREVIDPNRANLRSAPKNVEDVFIAARNAHIVSLNNLSYIKPEYQDALCCLATGGGYAGRTLYTNGEETVFDVKKPVMLNGIATVVTAQDLLGRTVHIDLPAIELRLSEVEIKNDFEANKGAILGGLLDLFVRARALLPDVVIDEAKRPRMADFAHLGEAVYQATGKPPGKFLADYEVKRRDGVHRTLDASPVAVACMAYLEQSSLGFEGTVKGLFEAVSPYRPDGETWPRSPKGFADAFRRVAPALRLIGIHAGIGTKPTRDGYPCHLKTTPTYMSQEGKLLKTSSPSSPSSQLARFENGKREHRERCELVSGLFPPQTYISPPAGGKVTDKFTDGGGPTQRAPIVEQGIL